MVRKYPGHNRQQMINAVPHVPPTGSKKTKGGCKMGREQGWGTDTDTGCWIRGGDQSGKYAPFHNPPPNRGHRDKRLCPRPVRVRFFGIYCALRVRSASSPCPLPFSPTGARII
eukprot:gene18895-biopygen11495